MGKTLSPLRYPGGKSQLIKRVHRLIEKNGWRNRLYVEPFAGGFGVGLYLLANNIVDYAVINDYDQHIYHFWEAALYHTNELVTLIRNTPITLKERENQRAIYSNPNSNSLHDGFATLYLNRVNYSGVLFAGPIGGKEQKSAYSLGCRFNKENIIQRILFVGSLRNRIQLFNLDASELIMRHLSCESNHSFFNIDPPYVKKGKSLYSVYFTEEDHRSFANIVKQYLESIPWIITYDNCELVREIYNGFTIHEFELYHSAHDRSRGNELVITNLSENRFEW